VIFFFTIGSRFLFSNRILIFVSKSISDFEIAIAITIAIEKPIRIDRDSILICELFATHLQELLYSILHLKID